MSNSTAERPPYGLGDTSFRAAGGEAGIRKLCLKFYEVMDTLPQASHIRGMHKEDLSVMVDKLTLFLSMWLGGPNEYHSKYGHKGMPQVHQHFVINKPEAQAWLDCMKIAIEEQEYAESFKRYLYNQLCRPAEMIRLTSRNE